MSFIVCFISFVIFVLSSLMLVYALVNQKKLTLVKPKVICILSEELRLPPL